VDIYTQFALYVAKKLNLRPAEILDEWSVPELLVTYGYYANEEAQRNFEDWKSLDPKQRMKVQRPKEYAVYFRGVM